MLFSLHGVEVTVIGAVDIICTTLILVAIVTNIINKRIRYNTKKYSRAISFTTGCAMIVYLVHALSVTLFHLNVYPKNPVFCKWLIKYVYMYMRT